MHWSNSKKREREREYSEVVPFFKFFIMRKKVNANKHLYQRTKNDEALREWRKTTYEEAKRNYQGESNKAKLHSWKEYCNVAASVNPWSQVYKIATGKTKEVNKMTTINRPDGIETTSLQENINEILDHLYKEDGGEEKPNHKTIRKAVEEPIHTEDDVEFTPDEIKHTIESFGQKKAPRPDGITGGIYQRVFLSFPRIITTMYNQCLKLGQFPKRW